MRLSQYITGTDHNNGISDLIIQTTYPFMVGKAIMVSQGNTEEIEEMNLLAVNEKIAKCQGHSVYIIIQTVLSGEKIPQEECIATLKEMADFFTKYRLEAKPGKYRKFCENPSEIPPKEIRDYYKELKLRKRRQKEEAESQEE